MRQRSLRMGLVVGLLLLSTAVPAHAGAVLPPITIAPTSGPPGTNIAVSGTGCDTTVLLNLLFGQNAVVTGEVQPGQGGAWNGVLMVPANATAGQVYSVTAFCGVEGAQYAPRPFTVTGGATPTTTTVPTGTPPPVPTPIPIPPRFTG